MASPVGKHLRDYFGKLGPGLITGASDDDPSGIGTYSIAGAQFGYQLLWTALITFPLMAVIQLLCARLGIVSGHGLAGLLRKRHSVWVLPCCGLLAIANIVNISADLGAMAAATSMVLGIPAFWLTPLYTAGIGIIMAWNSYRQTAALLKWMTLVLFAYVAVAFLSHPDWGAVLRGSWLPHIEFSRAWLATLVAVLGTTISPYLFFWQASQEVEERGTQRANTATARQRVIKKQEENSRFDVITGMLLSNVIMYFVILAAAATLHVHGLTEISTTGQAAEALRPLAGNAAYLLFTLGIVGTGMLAVPVLAGSTAYAIAEAAKWRGSLEDTPRRAPRFYGVLGAALVGGLVLNHTGLAVVSMLFLAAVINGILAPPLLIIVMLLSTDQSIMGRYVASPIMRVVGWLTAVVMSGAAICLCFT